MTEAVVEGQWRAFFPADPVFVQLSSSSPVPRLCTPFVPCGSALSFLSSSNKTSNKRTSIVSAWNNKISWDLLSEFEIVGSFCFPLNIGIVKIESLEQHFKSKWKHELIFFSNDIFVITITVTIWLKGRKKMILQVAKWLAKNLQWEIDIGRKKSDQEVQVGARS